MSDDPNKSDPSAQELSSHAGAEQLQETEHSSKHKHKKFKKHKHHHGKKTSWGKWLSIAILIAIVGLVLQAMDKGSGEGSWLSELKVGNYSAAMDKLMNQSAGMVSGANFNLSTETMMKDLQAALPHLKRAGFTLTELDVELGIPPKLIPHFHHDPTENLDMTQSFEALKGNHIGTTLLTLLVQANTLQLSLSVPGMPFNEIEIELGPIPSIQLQHMK